MGKYKFQISSRSKRTCVSGTIHRFGCGSKGLCMASEVKNIPFSISQPSKELPLDLPRNVSSNFSFKRHLQFSVQIIPESPKNVKLLLPITGRKNLNSFKLSIEQVWVYCVSRLKLTIFVLSKVIVWFLQRLLTRSHCHALDFKNEFHMKNWHFFF